MQSPTLLTIDRLEEKEEVILAQSTSQCCRFCCCQPSINWVLAEQDNFQPGQNPFDLVSSGWIHEESSWIGRSCSWMAPGCRAQKYVQHAGPAPPSIRGENNGVLCCACQPGLVPSGLSDAERTSNVVATHEKDCTCGWCVTFPIPFPSCCCLPYLETRNLATGAVIGKTTYVCDACIFIPKYDVTDASGHKLYHIRPNTCFGGMCIQCNCNGKGGKCLRIPFIVRDPVTREPLMTNGNEDKAQVDSLWTGWANECCTMKNAYHLVYPRDASAEHKLLLTGSAILIDVTVFEQESDD